MNDKIAIYLRLSLADGDLKKGSKDESNSIENQRMLLHDYISIVRPQYNADRLRYERITISHAGAVCEAEKSADGQ